MWTMCEVLPPIHVPIRPTVSILSAQQDQPSIGEWVSDAALEGSKAFDGDFRQDQVCSRVCTAERRAATAAWFGSQLVQEFQSD